MPETNPATGAAIDRPIPLRLRRDLTIRRQQMGHHPIWVVKDPLSQQYTQLREEEYFILQMLDGTSSIAEIQRAFEGRFAPHRLPTDRVHGFLGQLYDSGLLLAEATGQGEQLLRRAQTVRRRGTVQAWSNPLAIRFRGIDPECVLNWLYPKCRFLFTRAAVAVWSLLGLMALCLVILNIDVLQSRLPEFGAFFYGRNLIWIFVTLAVVKILHEFGHGLLCKHFGGECHELGVMLLVFTPCLYCNVSDAWMLPNKWQRAAISAAGMYIELMLASICTFLWWYSEPGALNAICLNVMFVCSVSTVLLNGNPLLRYDGYYILSDIIEVPNLSQQSRNVIVSRLARWTLGVDLPEGRAIASGRRGWIALYGVLAFLYRIWIVTVILWFCYQVLKPLRLEVLAMALGVVVAAGLIVPPLNQMLRWLRQPTTQSRIHRPRALLATALVATLLIGLLFVPLPYRVPATAVIEPAGAQRVYISVPGRLQQTKAAGGWIEKDRPLATLTNQQLETELADLQGRRNAQHSLYESLQIRMADSPDAAAQVPSARAALAALDRRVESLTRQQQQLHLMAPISGTVIAPPRKRDEQDHTGQLPSWRGTPLDDHNLGCYLQTGETFCMIGNPEQLEAILIVDQESMQFVSKDQQVRILLDQSPGTIAEGQIVELAQIDMKVAPRELHDGRYLPLQDGHGARPMKTLYRARVAFTDTSPRVLIGARGRAKILANPRSLADRFVRYVAETFNFGA